MKKRKLITNRLSKFKIATLSTEGLTKIQGGSESIPFPPGSNNRTNNNCKT